MARLKLNEEKRVPTGKYDTIYRNDKMTFKPTPEMEQARKKVLSDFNTAKEEKGYDDDNLYELLLEFEDKYMPDKLREAVKNHNESDVSDDLYEWGKWVYKDTPFYDKYFKDDKPESTNIDNIDNITKVITANDLGRKL